MLPKVSRPARIICLDDQGRILLLRLRDPFHGTTKWEPPGGGLLADESENFLGYRWFSVDEIQLSPERIEPIQLLEIIADLWRR